MTTNHTTAVTKPNNGSVPSEFLSLLVCPVCHGKLLLTGAAYYCQNSTCGRVFPVSGRIPILVSESVSPFSLEAYTSKPPSTWAQTIKKVLRRFVPRISFNLAAKRNLAVFAKLLLQGQPHPLVLVLGGAEVGVGMAGVLANRQIQFLESDIVIGPRTGIVFDASYIPLPDDSVDGIVIQAVLEYIPDPERTVAEIFRVLKPGGLVYSEMPFMQDVHGGRFDFTRLTHLGHLRLYRHFEEIQSGPCAGPGTALAWALQHFLLAVVGWSQLRDLVKVVSGFLFFWLKYFDYALANTPAGIDSAAGTYLLAKKSPKIISDRRILASYRGAIPVAKII